MRRRVLASLLLILLTGCGYAPWSHSVSEFTSVAPPVLDAVAATYTTANSAHELEEEAELARSYASMGFRPGASHAFLTNPELAPRLNAIKVLHDYATLVGDLVLGKRGEALAAQTKALKQSLSTMKAPTATTSKKTLTSQQMTYALQGLDLAVKPLIEHQVKRRLPTVIKAADPSVQQICTLLGQDLGDLRIQTQNDYRTLLIDQDQFLRDNKDTLSAIDTRNEIMKLLTIEQDGIRADAAIVSAQKALKDMAETHHRLAGGTK